MMESRPYIKKQNLTEDTAQWTSWQVHLRIEEKDRSGEENQEENDDDMDGNNQVEPLKNEKDLFVTAVRRKYIPPLMECYQDILIISQYNCEKTEDEDQKRKKSKEFLKSVHQKVVDTLHPQNNTNTNIY